MHSDQQVFKLFKNLLLLLCLSGGFEKPVYAHEKVAKVLRFMSTRSSDVNLRRGPGQQYPIDWKLMKSQYPLLVVAEYGTWRKVKDIEGSEGWVHQGMLSHKKTAVLVKSTILYKKANTQSKPIAKIESKVIVTLKEIKPAWCRVVVGDVTGWIERKNLWGVLKNE